MIKFSWQTAVISATVGLSMGLLSLPANAGIIESFDGSKRIKDSTGGGKDSVTVVSDPQDSSGKAYKHTVSGGYRAESSLKKTKIGETYWYGWSLYIPEDFKNPKSFNIIAQQAAYPSKRDKKFPCGAVGHRMDIRSNGDIYYASQHKGNQKGDMECVKYPLTKLDQVRGKRVDFVQHVKWTGDSDGFLKIWMRTNDGEYKQLVDRKGPTWWNDEGEGPYLKVGVYAGSGNKGKANTSLFSDNYKIGDGESSFEEVAPK